MASNDAPFRAPPTRLGPMLMAIGPAIVVSGSVIGSGELINVPVQAAVFGFVLFWAVALSCVIKYFLQVELGRYCLVHNRTTIQALNTCPGPKFRGTGWVGILYMVGYTVSMVTVAGILAATAGLLQSVWPMDWLGLSEDHEQAQIIGKNIWGIVTFFVVSLMLWRGFYGELEKLVAILVAGFSLSIVVALLLLVLFPDPRYPLSGGDVLSGLTFSLGELDPQLAAFAVISLLGALGTTANELFMYPYWILEKGYAQHLGPASSDGWLERARGWVRVLRVDTGSATLLATVITAAYFLVGSAVLHQHGKVWQFTADDILDWPGLASKLTDGGGKNSTSPSHRVWELLPADVQTAVVRAAEAAGRLDKPDPGFTRALNEIVHRRDFHRERDFQQVDIPDQVQRFLGRDRAALSNQQVQRLNRLLLEASFPMEIATSIPSGSEVVKEISKIYTETYGEWSYVIFMFGGFCTLFSTIVVVVAASGRMWTDLLSSMGTFKWDDQKARRRCNRVFQTVYLAAFLAITLFVTETPEKLVILGQYINGLFNTPLIMFGICWLAFHTDRRLRMGRATAVLLLTTVAIIVTCLAVGIYSQAG